MSVSFPCKERGMVCGDEVRLGKKTKDLIPQLEAGENAVIDHEDLDGMGATGLIESGVCAVINVPAL